MKQPAPMRRLERGELSPDEAVPWDVYDARGTLILRAGALLARADLCDRLIARGAFRPDDAPAGAAPAPVVTSPFDELDDIRTTLRGLLRTVHDRVDGASEQAFRDLAGRVRYLAWKHADAAIGYLMFDDAAPYIEIHPLMVALVSELIARRLGLDEPARHSTCAAALTCNVAMLALQDVLSRQAGPLNDKQRAAVRAHPGVAARLLGALGIDDETWLEVVRDHHEKNDGSGYPAGKSGDDISLPARVVALADRYAAMVLPREYRDGLHVQQAMRDIFLERGAEIDAELASVFIKELGIYPPGIFVVTRSGERAVVIKRGLKNAQAPVISCYADGSGRRYRRPIQRDTAEASVHRVAEVIAREDTGSSIAVLWDLVH